MIKYLISYEEEADTVANTRADAEEHILSLAEEAAYEDYVAEVFYYNVNTKEYFEEFTDKMQEVNDYRKRYLSWQKPFSTRYGFMLNYFGGHYSISEVGVLE